MSLRVSNHLPYSYLYATSLSGRVAVPVPPSQLPYSFFKHVAGIQSQTSAAYSLDKLKILDTLIDRLQAMKQNQVETSLDDQTASPERIDALIEEYGRQLHSALVADSLPYIKPAAVEPGSLLSVAA